MLKTLDSIFITTICARAFKISRNSLNVVSYFLSCKLRNRTKLVTNIDAKITQRNQVLRRIMHKHKKPYIHINREINSVGPKSLMISTTSYAQISRAIQIITGYGVTWI